MGGLNSKLEKVSEIQGTCQERGTEKQIEDRKEKRNENVSHTSKGDSERETEKRNSV